MPLNPSTKEHLIRIYRDSFERYGDSPEASQWSPRGQEFRFEKLAEIAPLTGRSVLDVGCSIGDLYPFLIERFGSLSYTGVDIVSETVSRAATKYPGARFICKDILTEEWVERFDYALISGVFNNAIPDATEFLKEMIVKSFEHCRLGLGFNFISTYHNFEDPKMAYHDPADIFRFCLDRLSRKVRLHHHYENADVSVFVYR